MAWHVHAASAIGSAHLEDGRPCQDAVAHRRVGDVLVAAVCDGAGSSARSHVGARLLSESLVDELAAAVVAGGLGPGLPRATLEAPLAAFVAAARERLLAQARLDGAAPGDYATTLVGAVAGPAGGFFFHVGDGIAVARPRAPERPEVVSLPENGEYVNETYFVTGEEWRAHLRLLELPEPLELVALLSDGAAPFVMARGGQALHRGFVEPVVRHLAGRSEAEGSAALEGTLADPRTYAITTDDKTLLLARWS